MSGDEGRRVGGSLPGQLRGGGLVKRVQTEKMKYLFTSHASFHCVKSQPGLKRQEHKKPVL